MQFLARFLDAVTENNPLILAGARAGLVASNAWQPEYGMLEQMLACTGNQCRAFWFYWVAHQVLFGSAEDARTANKLYDALIAEFGRGGCGDQVAVRVHTDIDYRYEKVSYVDTPLGEWRFGAPQDRRILTRVQEVFDLQVFINAAWSTSPATCTQTVVAQALLQRGEWPAAVRKPARVNKRFLFEYVEDAGVLATLLDELVRASERVDPPSSLENRVAEAMAQATSGPGAVYLASAPTSVLGKATPDKSGNDFKSLEID